MRATVESRIGVEGGRVAQRDGEVREMRDGGEGDGIVLENIYGSTLTPDEHGGGMGGTKGVGGIKERMLMRVVRIGGGRMGSVGKCCGTSIGLHDWDARWRLVVIGREG